MVCMSSAPTYAMLVDRHILPGTAAIRALGSDTVHQQTIKGAWWDLLAVLGHQQLVPEADHQELDLRRPWAQPGQYAGLPGWDALVTTLCVPDRAGEQERVSLLLYTIWRGDGMRRVAQLARLSACLKILQHQPYQPRLHTPVYSFLRTAVAHAVDWDVRSEASVLAWERFRRGLRQHVRPQLAAAARAMPAHLRRLDHSLNQLVQYNQLDQAYNLTLRGLTSLFYLHQGAILDRHRRGLPASEQAVVAGLPMALWALLYELL